MHTNLDSFCMCPASQMKKALFLTLLLAFTFYFKSTFKLKKTTGCGAGTIFVTLIKATFTAKYKI